MSEITGRILIGGVGEGGSGAAFRGIDPATGIPLAPEFREADASQIGRAVEAAERAFVTYSTLDASTRAAFLRAIAVEIMSLGQTLLDRAHAETALPQARLEIERARTVNQLKLMADVLDEGSWVNARIDTGDAKRMPAPKPDLRSLLRPLGPVAVFSASNFPFAYSVAGGDTASAFAAGCTVVCKAHPAHPGTSELTADAIYRAADRTGISREVFSLVHGWSHESGTSLVQHRLIQAVGFTGSLRGGRAIYNAAAARAEPIPVYAEMGSVNPVFLLPSAVEERGAAIAKGLANSITQGVGQFCTNPGVVVGVASDSFKQLTHDLAEHIGHASGGTMLYEGLQRNFTDGVLHAQEHGATLLARAQGAEDGVNRGVPHLLAVPAAQFISDTDLRAELFGPASVVVTGNSMQELEDVARAMEGQLTASIHGTDEELVEHRALISILERKVGRLVFNGYPTGVEVGHAIVHGGPYPASTDGRTTAVGSAAITRFARPVCFQNFPKRALPVELRNKNKRKIWRMVNGTLTKDNVS